MTFNYLIIINILAYFISLKIFFKIFKLKYTFPFRHADLYSFFSNLIIFFIFSIIFYPEKSILIFFINLNLFYIFFHLINMIVTSPRTKMIIDLKESRNKDINIKRYLKKYNCKVIVDNRIRRLKTNKQIIQKGKYFYLRKDKKNFLYIISLIFSFIEKI